MKVQFEETESLELCTSSKRKVTHILGLILVSSHDMFFSLTSLGDTVQTQLYEEFGEGPSTFF